MDELPVLLTDRSQCRILPRAKSAKYVTARQRSELIKAEQIAAAQQRIAVEAGRRKLLIDDTDVDKVRRPRFYIELARLRSLSRQQGEGEERQSSGRSHSTRTHYKQDTATSEAIVPRMPSPRPSAPLLRRTKDSSLLPAWVTARQDFSQAYSRLKEDCFQDVVSICRKSALFRSTEEKAGLRKWVGSITVLAGLKEGVMEEVMNRLHTVDFPERSKGRG